jgi:hypothetical protein
MIEAPTRIQAGNVENLVSEMLATAARVPGEALSLDMRHVESITRSAGAFLSNALLTNLASVRLDVLPPARLPVEKIMSSSLGFAFAHRSGHVHVRDVDETALGLDRWRLPYTPARQRLPFDEYEVPDEPSFFLRAHAAFVNPHETARRHHRTDVPLRVQSWLHTVLPPRALVKDFLQDLHDLVYELVDNVAEHADVIGAEAKSIVHVSVARGKQAETRDRIWVLVMDTGPGILTTAIPKFLGLGQGESVDGADQAQLLRGLFNGEVPQAPGRARGLGLPRVHAICRRWKAAKLEVATDRWRLAIDGDTPVVTEASLKLQGTLVLARFTTPPAAID